MPPTRIPRRDLARCGGRRPTEKKKATLVRLETKAWHYLLIVIAQCLLFVFYAWAWSSMDTVTPLHQRPLFFFTVAVLFPVLIVSIPTMPVFVCLCIYHFISCRRKE